MEKKEAAAPAGQTEPNGKPYGMMMLLIAIWGSFAAVNRLAMNSLDVYQVQTLTFGIAVISQSIWMGAARKFPLLRQISPRQWFWLLVLACLSFLYYLLYSFSLAVTNPVTASSINYLFPLFITLLAVPINHEKMTVGKGISVLMGVAGMVLIVTNGDFTSLQMDSVPGMLMAFFGAICWALFSTLGKMAQVDIVVSNFVYAVVGFVGFTILLLTHSHFALPGPAALLAIGWNSVMGLCVNYFLWFKALRTAKASFVASMSFITPFATIFFIALILHEPITWANLLGLVIIVSGVAVQNLRCFQPKEKEKEA